MGIEERITSSGGSFNIQMAPKVVTATDEADLANNWRKRNKKMQRFRVMMMKKKNKSEWAARLDLMVMRAMRKTVIKIKTVPVVSEDMIKRARKYPVLYFTCWIINEP